MIFGTFKMKQTLLLAVIGVAGLAVGFGGGFALSHTKSKTVISDMQAKMQQTEASSQQKISNYDRMVSRLTTELQLANMELEKLKSAAPVEMADSTSRTAGSAARTEIDVEYEKPDGPTSMDANTRLYKIQSGDSLWAIAQRELGNGSRYTEILKLNPKISEKSNLVVGSNLKIPAK